MSPSQTRRDWELGVQQVLLAGGASLPENDRENRLRDLLDEAWAKPQRPAETARKVRRLLHDKFDMGYLADAPDPWHPDGGPPR